MGLLYVAEAYPMALFRDVWPVYLRQAEMPLRWIGLVSGLYVAWSAKALWSPVVDRFGERRHWIAGALLAMAALQLLLPRVDPLEQGALLFALLAAICVASATQDIAIDAYTIGLVDRGEEGQTNAVRITAYRVGLVLFGGGLLLLPTRFGWDGVHVASAGCAAGLAALLWLCPRVAVPEEARRDVLGAFRPWIGRPDALRVLGFVVLFRLADMALGPMVATFWVDRGLSPDEMALVRVSVGSVATIAGAWLGALLVARLGIGRALLWTGLLSVGSNLGYAAAAQWPESGRFGIYAASVVESFCSGLGVAAFMSFLMRICQREHAAVQYATLSGLYALTGTLGGVVSGAAVEALGYAGWFATSAAIAAPAFLFLPAARRWLENEAPD